MKLLLFDIDGTLMLSGGAGFRAIDRAFERLFGVRRATAGIAPDGKTDPLILREILTAHRLAGDDQDRAIDELRRVYEPLFAEEMVGSPARLMPGVPELLETLAGLDDVHLGLVTGNFEPSARVKLGHFGLNRHFPYGAFGSDAEDRRALPPLAVRRAEAHHGRPIGLGRHVVVVGDTPRDIECAHASGTTAVAVATGRYSTAELEAAGADVVLADLGATRAALVALIG